MDTRHGIWPWVESLFTNSWTMIVPNLSKRHCHWSSASSVTSYDIWVSVTTTWISIWNSPWQHFSGRFELNTCNNPILVSSVAIPITMCQPCASVYTERISLVFSPTSTAGTWYRWERELDTYTLHWGKPTFFHVSLFKGLFRTSYGSAGY